MQEAIRHPNLHSRKGSVLLLVLGVLALLTLLGTALLYMSREEEKSSRNFLDQTRAQFACESGVEYALAKLAQYDGPLSAVDDYIQPLPNDGTIPINYLRQSSFGTEDSTGDGFQDIAGHVSETYADKGDYYVLRVESSQSKININDTNSPLNIDTDPYEDQWTAERDYQSIPIHLRCPGLPGYPDKDPDWLYKGDAGYDPNRAELPNAPHPRDKGRLWSIVKELSNILFTAVEAPDGTSLGQQIADAIFATRRAKPGDQFSSMSEIRNVLVPKIIDEGQYRKLESHLTLASWQDNNVLRPTFQWRINTPPRMDPNDPKSSHVKYMFCDYPCLYSGFTWQPAPRPGSGNTGLRGADMMDPVIYDFNVNGVWDAYDYAPTIDAPDPTNPLAYNEHFRHDRDIYLYSDMQTRYYDVEGRSPVDVNHSGKEVLEALIKPVCGWYLKEEPAIWDGEDVKARAEDWSNPVPYDTGEWWYPFPWHCASRALIWIGAVFAHNWQAGTSEMYRLPDKSQYYYYDSYFKHVSAAVENGTKRILQFAEKSARFGELTKTKSFGTIPPSGSVPLSQLLAGKIYDRIHPASSVFHPFVTWEEFEEFLLELADPAGGNHLTENAADFDLYMAHALIANFNPNSRLNDFNPNKRQFLHVDKSQLISNTTEFCFHSFGFFDLESLGCIRGTGGGKITQAVSSLNTMTMESFRVSSQNQFLHGYDVLAGAGPYFSPANGVVDASEGQSLQSYPEPELATGDFISESSYDGCLMLSTWKPGPNEMFAQDPAWPVNNCMYASFEGTLNLDAAKGDGQLKSDGATTTWVKDNYHFYTLGSQATPTSPFTSLRESDPFAQLPANLPAARRLTKSTKNILDAGSIFDAPGNLYPDGALSDAGRSIRYESKNNIGDSAVKGRKGSIQFWMKPNYSVAHSNRIRKLFTCPPRWHDSQVVDNNSGPYFPSSDACPYGIVTNPSNPSFPMRGYEMQQDNAWDFSLYYFARGGEKASVDKITGELSDRIDFTYDPNYDYHDGQWLPTRALFLNAGYTDYMMAWSTHEIFGIGTNSVNQSWRQPWSQTDIDPYNMEARQWSHIGFSWDWVGIDATTPPARFFYMNVNAKAVDVIREQGPLPIPSSPPPSAYELNNSGYFGSLTDPLPRDIQTTGSGKSLYMGFGESSSAQWGNDVADATFDDIASSIINHLDGVLQYEYGYGRYYSEDDAVYTSPNFDLFAETNSDAKTLALFQVSWTGYWPRPADNGKPADHFRFNDNLSGGNSGDYKDMIGIMKTDSAFPSDPMSFSNGGGWTGDWIPFSIDIVNPATGKWRYADEWIVGKDKMPNYAGGSRDLDWRLHPLEWSVQRADKLRFRVYFNIAGGQTLYTSPVFDDITFVFKGDNAKILFWENE